MIIESPRRTRMISMPDRRVTTTPPGLSSLTCSPARRSVRPSPRVIELTITPSGISGVRPRARSGRATRAGRNCRMRFAAARLELRSTSQHGGEIDGCRSGGGEDAHPSRLWISTARLTGRKSRGGLQDGRRSCAVSSSASGVWPVVAITGANRVHSPPVPIAARTIVSLLVSRIPCVISWTVAVAPS